MEMTEKLPLEIPESKILRTMHTRAEDFLKEVSKSETFSLPSKLASEQQNAPAIPTSDSGYSKPQENKLEENVAAAGIHLSKAGADVLQESNGSKLESEQQNAPITPALDSVSSTLEECRLEENVDSAGVDPSQDGRDVLQESNNGLNLEFEQQNALDAHASGIVPSKLQESNGSMMDSEQQKTHDIPASDIVSSKLQNYRVQENVVTVGFDSSKAGGNVLPESNGSSVFSTGGAMLPQASKNGSRSLDSSRPRRQGETQVIEQFERGIFVTLILRPDGIKVFKRVRFR